MLLGLLFLCGMFGPRVDVVYAYDHVNRLADVQPSILQALGYTDQIYSAAGRVVRWNTDDGCTPTIRSIAGVRPGPFQPLIDGLYNAGLNRNDRKYLVFVDAFDTACGQALRYHDDRPGQENPNNTEIGLAVVYSQCWFGLIPAHELGHMLGGVQDSAADASGEGHCTDRPSLLCLSQSPRIDANDDYFNLAPLPGSYLSTHWNVAASQFLAPAPRYTVFIP